MTSLRFDQLAVPRAAALVSLFHNVTGMLETDDHVRCFLTYFSKGFDTVSHSILLDKHIA
jgi:hypothetical protein